MGANHHAAYLACARVLAYDLRKRCASVRLRDRSGKLYMTVAATLENLGEEECTSKSTG